MDALLPPDTSSPSDAGAMPPPDCVAPCVWELIKNCLPSGPCFAEIGPESLARVGQSCSETGNWLDLWFIGTPPFSNGYAHTIFADDRSCYGVALNIPRYLPGSPIVLGASRSWTDANVSVVASQPLTASGLGPVRCVSTGESFSVNSAAPHCEPWRAAVDAADGNFGCSPGCCEAVPTFSFVSSRWMGQEGVPGGVDATVNF